jgi:hypothetical protein
VPQIGLYNRNRNLQICICPSLYRNVVLLQRPVFVLRPVHLRFMVDKLVPRQGFLRALPFPAASIIPLLLLLLLLLLLILLLLLRPCDSLGLPNYGRPFFPIHCLLSPSRNLHLPRIILHIFQPSQSRSSPTSTYLWCTLTNFLNCPSLIHSYCTSNPFHSLRSNICCYASIFI